MAHLCRTDRKGTGGRLTVGQMTLDVNHISERKELAEL
jgi:hypothetical protein